MTEYDNWEEEQKRLAAENRHKAGEALPYASEHGMRLEVFLNGSASGDILKMVSKGEYGSPEEAVYFLLNEMLEIRSYPDIRREVMTRRLEEAAKGPFRDADDVFEDLREKMRNHREPFIWQQTSRHSK